MKITKKHNIVFASLIIIILSVLTTWIFLQNKNDKIRKRNDASADSLSRVRVEDGITTIELSEAEQSNSGITTIKLAQTLHQAQLTAYGSVVSIVNLSKDVQNFEADKAQLAKSEQNLLISRQNFERIKNLYKKNLASEQDFQSSQAAFLSDQADENSAQSNLNSLKSSIVEQWGDEISRWIFNGTSELQRILSFDDKLIQISLPPGEENIGSHSQQKREKMPAKIYVQTAPGNGKQTLCRFVSAGHLVNAQFQTKILYYIASREGMDSQGVSLSGGMNLKIFLPVGKNLSGVIVPSSSIVWYQGKAWIYAEESPGKFIRVEVDTGNPTDNGFFIPQNKGLINPGVTIVERGAQLLLSQELTPAQGTQTGGDEND